MTEAEILRSLVKRIEAVREEKKLLAGSERDLFAEAKGKNIDGKALRRVLQRRAMDDAAREAFDDLVDQYEHALGSKAVVRAAVASGASVREAAKIAKVTHGVAERAARGVPKNANTGTDRAGTDDGAPQAERGGEGRVSADPILKSEADASTRKDDESAGDDVLAEQPAPPVGSPTSASDTPSPAGGATSGAGTLPTAAALSPGAVPAGDPDEHWEKRDGEGNFILAHQVANGRVPHPNPAAVRARLEAEARADTPAVAQIAGRALASLRDEDMPEMPAYLRRQAPTPRGVS
jgi:uncharacterized protein (UPF0335 family)